MKNSLTKKTSDPLGFVSAGRDAQAKKLATLADIRHDPELRSSDTRHTYLGRHVVKCDVNLYLGEQVEIQTRSFYCTQGGTENKPLFDEMEALCEQRPVATLAVSQEEVKKELIKTSSASLLID
jgi:hypothetical protein